MNDHKIYYIVSTMKNKNNYDYLLADLTKLNGVGIKTMEILKKKKVNNIFDLLWRLPKSYTDRTLVSKICDLQIGKTQTIRIVPLKYQFPRVRNLPNTVNCIDETGKIDCIFFNSYEGYVRKILPLKEEITISGKISSYKGRYQITNPTYISQDGSLIETINNKYSLTEGITEKIYNKIIKQILENLPILKEWHDKDILKKFNNESWNNAIIKLHDPKNINNYKANFYKRLAYDEILASFLVNSEIRKKIKKIKKVSKKFNKKAYNDIISKLNFNLTNDQKMSLEDINQDLNSKSKMFRLLQGDVGSGKTIVALISSLNVISSGFQVALMAPTEILARQHYELAKRLFPNNLSIELLSSKSENIEKKRIVNELKDNKIKMVFGTHAIFQKKIIFANLGFIIIDEQHKFGVRQRKLLSDKGGDNCDVLLMSATPIPRTMMMSLYGDMDISKITEKPANRKKIITLSKPEKKINELWPFIKKQINQGNQIFWVCPLIEESSFLDYSSAKKKFDSINKKFPGNVGLIHGALDKSDKEKVLEKFLKKSISILVSTTVIEVGIDFPNANLIIIENANKFGLSQLHQLRGRVGRGENQGNCILLFKDGLSKNAVKRIKILKKTDDGFIIAEEDLKLRGFGDLIGFQQSGIKNFRFADPVIHEDLFKLAEIYVKENQELINEKKYLFLLKLFDRAEIINIEKFN